MQTTDIRPSDIIQSSLDGKSQRTRKGPVQWWFSLTSVPEPPANASFVKREMVRRSRLVSVVIFTILVLFMIYFPASLFMTPSAILSTTTILPVAVAATIFNRKGKPLVAGIIIVVA